EAGGAGESSGEATVEALGSCCSGKASAADPEPESSAARPGASKLFPSDILHSPQQQQLRAAAAAASRCSSSSYALQQQRSSSRDRRRPGASEGPPALFGLRPPRTSREFPTGKLWPLRCARAKPRSD
ncbi:hypothetical protein ENH_00029300, partial [Eimeria necatrix]